MDKLLLIDDENDVRYSFKRIFSSPDLILETAATIMFLKATNTARNALNVKSLHQIAWKNGLVMAIVMITTIEPLVGLIVEIAVIIQNLIRTSIVRAVLNVPALVV